MTQPAKGRRGATSSSLRPIGLPRALFVREDAYTTPIAVARTDARGRRGLEVRVESVEDQWRLAEGWWRESPQARTYFHVILDGGRPLTLYRDDITGAWYEQPYSEARRPQSGGGR